jgi:phosphopantetheine--protein transferase-like protein
MVNIETITDLYNKLSGGKIANGPNHIIKKSHFSSVLADRFKAELKKLGLIWNGQDITILQLLRPDNSEIQNFPLVNHGSKVHNKDKAVGIDIQLIDELPDCLDYWEEEFYTSNFYKSEFAYCLKKANPKQSFAGLYAAKEAIYKTGSPLTPDQIEIDFHQDKPIFFGYEISISHSGNYAVAVAIHFVIPNQIITENNFDENFIAMTNKKLKSLSNSIRLLCFLITLLCLFFLLLKFS